MRKINDKNFDISQGKNNNNNYNDYYINLNNYTISNNRYYDNYSNTDISNNIRSSIEKNSINLNSTIGNYSVFKNNNYNNNSNSINSINTLKKIKKSPINKNNKKNYFTFFNFIENKENKYNNIPKKRNTNYHTIAVNHENEIKNKIANSFNINQVEFKNSINTANSISNINNLDNHKNNLFIYKSKIPANISVNIINPNYEESKLKKMHHNNTCNNNNNERINYIRHFPSNKKNQNNINKYDKNAFNSIGQTYNNEKNKTMNFHKLNYYNKTFSSNNNFRNSVLNNKNDYFV